jgi:hypothetical protein
MRAHLVPRHGQGTMQTLTPCNFDPDLSPEHETNKRAAKARRVRYDARRGFYVDDEGCLRYDRYGQPL